MTNFRFSIGDFRLATSHRHGGGACLQSNNQKSKITRSSRAPARRLVRRSLGEGGSFSEGGFSLLEVLVALTIFALSAIILGSAYVNVLNAYVVAGRTAQTNEDVAFARSLVITQPDITKLENGGEFEGASGRRVKWSAEITPTTTADLFTVVFTCEVTETTAPQSEKTVQTFTLLRPTWSIDPAERSKLREDAKARIYEIQGKAPGGTGGTGRPRS